MYQLLAGKGDQARMDAVILNSALIFYVRGMVATIKEGVDKARDLLHSGQALASLKRWVEVQNNNPATGFARLADLKSAGAAL